MTKDEALQMCLEYIETDAHERRHVRWAIKEALAQEQEPVAQPASEEDMKIYKTIAANYHKDLSTPPQRTWVGLTDEEVRKICVNEWGGYEQCRAIEAKLKENNHG
jgi:hypothetical protein